MKLLILAAVVVSVLAADDDYHDTLDDEYDFSLLTMDQLTEISMCICGDGQCSELTASYKKHYPAAIEEACKRCSTSQRRIAKVFFNLLRDKLPVELKRCKDKHDPKGIYWDNFYSVIEKY